MKKPIILEKVRVGSGALIYSIKYLDNEVNEFISFNEIFYKEFQEQMEWINATIKIMADRRGCDEAWFKDEGVDGEQVYAIRKGKLRLYCVRDGRLSLIIGGGGIKKTRTYQEDPLLYSKVKVLRQIEEEFFRRLDEGEIKYCENELTGNLIFEVEIEE